MKLQKVHLPRCGKEKTLFLCKTQRRELQLSQPEKSGQSGNNAALFVLKKYLDLRLFFHVLNMKHGQNPKTTLNYSVFPCAYRGVRACQFSLLD